ncbi:MAG: ABC transporter permease [Actinomycetota bacterium]
MTNVAQEIAESSAQAGAAQAGRRPKSKTSGIIFKLAVGWLVFITGLTIAGWLFGDAIPLLEDPFARDREKISAGPSWSNLMGNASFGEDVLSQVVEGGKISLRIGFLVTLIGMAVGGGMGLLAGFYRGWVDAVVRVLINVTLSVPALLLVIFIVTIRDQELTTVIFALSLLAIPALARIVRASTLQVADREYVKAAQVLGVRRSKILVREVVPNVMPTMISFAFLTTGIIIVVEGTLSFLGLSVPPPQITWGNIIAEGRIKFAETPHMVVMPALVIFLTVLALNFVGDQLLKRYDIREAGIS